jgi:hypothetical protein
VPSCVRGRRGIISRLLRCSINAKNIGNMSSLTVYEAPRRKIVRRWGGVVGILHFSFSTSRQIYLAQFVPPVKCPRQQAARLYVKHELIFQ